MIKKHSIAHNYKSVHVSVVGIEAYSKKRIGIFSEKTDQGYINTFSSVSSKRWVSLAAISSVSGGKYFK